MASKVKNPSKLVVPISLNFEIDLKPMLRDLEDYVYEELYDAIADMTLIPKKQATALVKKVMAEQFPASRLEELATERITERVLGV